MAELIDVAPEESRWRTGDRDRARRRRPADAGAAGPARRLLRRHRRRCGCAAGSPSRASSSTCPTAARPTRSGSPASCCSRTRRSRGWVQRARRGARRATRSASSPPPSSPAAASGSPWPARPAAAAAAPTAAATPRSIIGFSQRGRPRRDRRRARRRSRSRSPALDAEAAARSSRRPRLLEQRRAAYDAVPRPRFDDLDVAACDAPDRRAGAAPRRDPRRRRPAQALAAADRRASTSSWSEARRQRLRSGASASAALDAEHGELVDSEDQVNDRARARSSGRRRRRSTDEQDGRARRGVRRRGRAGRPRGPRPVPRELRASARPADRARSPTPQVEIEHVDRRARRRSSGPTSSSGTTRTSAPPPSPTPTSRGSSTTSRRPAWPSGARSGAVGSPSGAARTWCRSPARCRPRRGDRGPARADQRDPAAAGVRGREGPAPDPAAAAGPGARPGLRARPARAVPGARPASSARSRWRRGSPQLRRFMDQLRRPEHAHDGDRGSRPRPAARRTPPRGDQRRALRPAHRRAQGDVPDAGGEERRREPGAGRVHRRLGAAVPARRRDALAAPVRAGLPRRGVRQGRLRVRRAAPCRPGRGSASSWSSACRWTR